MCISAFTPNGNVFIKDIEHISCSVMPGRTQSVLILPVQPENLKRFFGLLNFLHLIRLSGAHL